MREPRAEAPFPARPAAASEPRALCLNADDFGLHPCVNAGVLRLVAQQRVGAVSCMVGGPAWTATWIAELQGAGARAVDLGLHLDLTEHPLLGGTRRELRWWIARALTPVGPPQGLGAEIRAQLDAFEAGVGAPPSFVDGHQHVHQLRGVRELLMKELVRRYPASDLPWIRSTRAPAARRDHPGRDRSSAMKQQLIWTLGGAGLEAACRSNGVAQNRHLLGVYDFRGGAQRYASLLAHWLRQAARGDLLMCHPADGRAPGDALAVARQAEFDLLSGDRLHTLLGGAGVRLGRMSALLLSQRQDPPAGS